MVSSAFAGVSRSSGTSAGMKLVKPPNESGNVRPASRVIAGMLQSGARPIMSASATIPAHTLRA